MQLQAVAIDVHPPRASPMARRVRRWLPWRRFYYPIARLRCGVWRLGRVGVAWVFGAEPLKSGTLPRMAVPGWAHRFQGQTQRGGIFFGIWSTLLTTGLASFGSAFGSVMFGLAFAVHVGSILDLLRSTAGRTPRQIVVGGIGVGVALLALYVPLSRMVLHFVDARQWYQDAGPFASGDVVLFNPRAYVNDSPQAGDIVLFRGSDEDFRTGHVVYRMTGEAVDRVLAEPGSRVAWKSGELWVDGRQSNLRPLSGESLPDQPDLVVPANMYYIVPTMPSTANVVLGRVGLLSRYAVLQPRQNIVGRAIVRHYPIWRWWWMN